MFYARRGATFQILAQVCTLCPQSDAALCFKYYYFWNIFIHKMKPYTSNKFLKGTNHFDFIFIVVG